MQAGFSGEKTRRLRRRGLDPAKRQTAGKDPSFTYVRGSQNPTPLETPLLFASRLRNRADCCPPRKLGPFDRGSRSFNENDSRLARSGPGGILIRVRGPGNGRMEEQDGLLARSLCERALRRCFVNCRRNS